MSSKSNKIYNFFLLSSNNIINNSFSTFLLIIFVLAGKFKDATDIALISAFTIFITKIFSLNLRNIYIAKNKEINLDNHIIIRFLFSIILVFLSFLFGKYFIKIENSILYIFILIFIFQWIIELSFVKFEINSSYNKIKFFFVINLFAIIYIFLSVFFINDFFFKESLILYLFFLILFFSLSLNFKNIRLNKKILNNLKEILINTFTSFSFLSSFSLNLANLLWRILLTLFIGKILSSVIFFFYSIGSFPGTIFNASFGPTMVKNKVNPKYLFFFYIFYLVLVLFFLFFIFKYQLFYNFNQSFSVSFLKNISIFSLLGSLIMLFALYFRQTIINQHPTFSNKIFLKDFYVSVGITMVIPVLYFLGDLDYLAFSYFFASIISIIVYYNGKK